MYASFLYSCSTNPSTSVTNYTGACGFGSWSTTEADVSQPIPHALTADNFYVNCAVAPGTGKSFVYTVQKNGTDTGITVTISGSAVTAAADTAHTAAFAQGDTISVKAVPSGTPSNPAGLRWNLRQSASGTFAVLGGNSTTAITTTQFNVAQGATPLPSATEANCFTPSAIAGTASNLFVKCHVDPTPGNWTMVLRKESADTTLTCSITAGQTTASSDTSHTASFVGTDRWGVRCVAASTPAASRIQWGYTVTPTTDGDSCWGGSNAANQFTGAATQMMRVLSQQGSLSTADSAAYSTSPAGTAKALYGYVQTTPGGGKSWTFGMFKNGSSSTLTLSATANGVFSATGLTEAVAQEDFINIDVIPVSTPAASRLATGITFSQSAPATTPVISVSPVASGTASKTFSFTSTTGTWTNSPTATSYQWQRDVAGNLSYSNISSQTSANYTATSSDLTCNVRCVITASNAAGSTTAASNALGPVGDQLAVVSSVGAEWCANATVVYTAGGGAPTTPTYLNPSTAAQTTGWSSWYV
jgi:hypothetical protein